MEEFVTYELAVKLKELGFNDPCFNLYDFRTKELMYKIPNIGEVGTYKCANHNKTNHISAPLYQQAFRWFREKHGLDGESCRYNLTHSEAKLLGINKTEVSHVYIVIINGEDFPELDKMVYYTSKEEAERACLEKLIEIVESKSK